MVILQYGTDSLTYLKIIRVGMRYAKCPDCSLIRDVDPRISFTSVDFPHPD